MRRIICALLLAISPMCWAANVDDYFSPNAASSIDVSPETGLNSDFLPADQAFTFSADPQGSNAITLKFIPQPGYYFYRSKFHFESSGPGVVIGSADYPKGITKDDPTYGTTEVYEEPTVIVLPVATKPDNVSQQIKLSVTYQGCAEAGLCYPSETKTVDISFEQPISISAETGTAPKPPQEKIESTPDVNTGSSGIYSYLLFFLSGIALAFTPCVLPMLPIMSSVVLGNARGKGRCFVLSSGYVVGMATCFTILGALMGVFGAQFNIQARLQSPWVLIPFGGAFMALAFLMHRSVNLELPAFITERLRKISSKAEGGSLGGATLMGVISGLITSPCVSAPLAGALLYIGQTGDVLRGAASLMALGLGMGAPLIAFAVGGGWLLPKAGRWMETIKNGFSLMLACLGIWLMARVLPDYAVTLMWSVIAGVVGYLMGALEMKGAKGIVKAKQLVGFILLVCAVVTAFDAVKSEWQESGSTPDSSRSSDWMVTEDFSIVKQAIQSSVLVGKPVVLDWYADWCVSCKLFEKNVLQKQEVKGLLKDFTLIKFDLTKTTQAQRDALNDYKLFGPPIVMLFDDKAKELPGLRVVGEVKAADFKARLEKAHSESKK